MQIARVLVAAHEKGIVHRDLTPDVPAGDATPASPTGLQSFNGS